MPATKSNEIDRRLVLLLAVACGLTVANTYYVQPLLDAISGDFHVGAGAAAVLVTMAQFGYALGLVFVVPLGDLLDRRRLVPTVLVVTAVALAAAASAPGIAVLGAAIAIVGLTSVVAQVLVPMAASLGGERHRGEVVGSVMTGLMLGTMLSRTVAGLVAEVAGWRTVFALAAGLMLTLAAVLSRALPRPTSRPASLSYGQLLGSVATLLRREPLLRRRALYGGLGFALFNLFWTTLAFVLSGSPFGFGEAAIGLFALIAAPATLAAPYAGRIADRGHARPVSGACFATIGLGFALGLAGAHSLPLLLAGALLVTVGLQTLHVTNQSIIYRTAEGAHSRVNSAYMVSYFFGGMAGSALAALIYSVRGWSGVGGLGLLISAVALAIWATEPRRRPSAISALNPGTSK